jgi:hypothetical protein
MILYKWWFENQMKQHPGFSFSLSADGARVAGLEHHPLGELLELPPRRAEIAERLARADARRPETGAERPAQARRVLEELEEDLRRLERLARRGLELARGRIGASALEEVDRQILGLASRQVAGFLFQPLIRKVLGGAAGSYREALELSAELYRELADSAGYQAGLIRRTLRRNGFL